VATAKDRRLTWIGDLPIGGRPVVLCWVKRVWSCHHELCEVKDLDRDLCGDRAAGGCSPSGPERLRSSRSPAGEPWPDRLQRLGRTLRAWRTELLAYFDTGGASNGPTEAINLLISKPPADTDSATSTTTDYGYSLPTEA
jgi:hypothetical protein